MTCGARHCPSQAQTGTRAQLASGCGVPALPTEPFLSSSAWADTGKWRHLCSQGLTAHVVHSDAFSTHRFGWVGTAAGQRWDLAEPPSICDHPLPELACSRKALAVFCPMLDANGVQQLASGLITSLTNPTRTVRPRLGGREMQDIYFVTVIKPAIPRERHCASKLVLLKNKIKFGH